jgi:hypothetical protein
MKAILKEYIIAASLLNINSCASLASNDIPNFLLEKFANTIENNPNSEVFEEGLSLKRPQAANWPQDANRPHIIRNEP